MLCYGSDMSEIKGDVENAGESMKRGAKKTGNRMEEGAEESKRQSRLVKKARKVRKASKH